MEASIWVIKGREGQENILGVIGVRGMAEVYGVICQRELWINSE
jgi:hypothetical protein